MKRETEYVKDPITGDDYTNFGGERVPVRQTTAYRVEMALPGQRITCPSVRFVIPTDSAREATQYARKRHPKCVLVSVREES